MNINDVVMINMPITTGKSVDKKAARREFNRKIARITEVVGDKYRLNVDGGRFLWPESVLAIPLV